MEHTAVAHRRQEVPKAVLRTTRAARLPPRHVAATLAEVLQVLHVHRREEVHPGRVVEAVVQAEDKS